MLNSMRLSEALQLVGQSSGVRKRDVYLFCGFTPLHFQTYVKAFLKLRFPDESFQVHSGLYGDLEGNLARALDEPAEGGIAVIEWADLDHRLGFRGSSRWQSQTLDDILVQTKERCTRLARTLEVLAQRMPLALITPTLPLPPMTHNPPVQSSKFELHLDFILREFLLDISGYKGIRIVSRSNLSIESPYHSRHDVKMDLATGFPYSLSHAEVLARLGTRCLFPDSPKKALITDLDHTLWKGILGDDGANGVSWSIEDNSQIHALYQQLVDSLAASGVLVAVASKNEPSLVGEALRRNDLLIDPESIFPIEVGWGPKSEAVERILRAWNIGADSAVFVDDSRMELIEVSERFPQIECLLFPSSNPGEALVLLNRLRQLFGKTEVREEDLLRIASLRAAPQLQRGGTDTESRDFVARLKARLTFEPVGANRERALELVNKTNQFNLNGVRFTEGEWTNRLHVAGSFLTVVSYEDRFGPLGRIAVLGGCFRNGHCIIDIFVMSCRAFSRQIEFQLLRRLFDRMCVGSLVFKYSPTERNGPMQTFLGGFKSSKNATVGGLEITLEAFALACPTLHHEVIDKWTTQ